MDATTFNFAPGSFPQIIMVLRIMTASEKGNSFIGEFSLSGGTVVFVNGNSYMKDGAEEKLQVHFDYFWIHFTFRNLLDGLTA